MRHLLITSAAVLLVLPCAAAAQQPAWAGKWRGTLVNLPARPGAPRVDVAMDIGAFPAADGTCSALRTTYFEGGEVRQVKDYRLCRGTGANDYYVDEGDGTKLTCRLIGDALVTPFKYGAVILVSTMRLRGEVLEEEILTVEDKPATMGPVPLTPRSVQRLELRRDADHK